MSISLWESADDLQQFEGQTEQMRTEATSELGIAPTPTELDEVVLQA